MRGDTETLHHVLHPSPCNWWKEPGRSVIRRVLPNTAVISAIRMDPIIHSSVLSTVLVALLLSVG